MGRIVAISAGDLESNRDINEYMVKMVNKESANVLFVPTASGDAEGYIDSIREAFAQFGCNVKNLCLVKNEYTEAEIDEILAWADIIYVGGGDTFSMMEVWEKYGLDEKLKEIYEQDRAILAGISAGAMCWFQCGHSNSKVFWDGDKIGYGWGENLLNFIPLAFCPHYEERVDSVDKMIEEKGISGVAMESDTAFVEENGDQYYIKSDSTKKVYLFYHEDGILKKGEVDVCIPSETWRRRWE